MSQQRRTFITVILLLLSLTIPSWIRAQEDTTGRIADAFATARDACLTSVSGQVCLGNGPASATGVDGDLSTFAEAGDVTKLAGLRTLVTQSDDEEWGIAYARLQAGIPEDGGEYLSLVLLGDVNITNTFDEANPAVICTITNLNAGNVNVHLQPDSATAVLSELAAQAKAPVSGRTEASDWYRVEYRPGELGWIRTENIAVDCSVDALAVTPLDDVTALYQSPLQQMNLTTGAGGDGEALNGLLLHSPLDEQARILINNVQLDISGAALVTATSNELTVTGLQGYVDVSYTTSTVRVYQGWSSTVPLSGGLAVSAPGEASEAVMGNRLDVLNSLIYGQPYAGPGSTVNGFSVNAGVDTVGADGMVRVNLSYTGDAGQCEADDIAPLSIVFVVNVTDTMRDSELAITRASIAEVIGSLNSDDQYGLVAFRSQAITITGLTSDFDGQSYETTFNNAVNRLQTEDFGTDSSFNAGLATAVSVLKAAPAESNQVIVFITDDKRDTDPETAVNVANEARNRNIRVVTLSIGTNVDPFAMLGISGGSPDNILAAITPLDIATVLGEFGPSLTRKVALTDFSLTYRVDTDRYEIVEDLLAFTGGEISGVDAVTWTRDVIYGGQRVELPLVLRATDEGDGPVGSAQITYSACGTESVEYPEISAPNIANSADGEAGDVLLLNGVLTFGDTGQGNVKAFDRQLWALDFEDDTLISVVTGGSGGAFDAILSGSTIEPLYTLTNFDGFGNSLSVFNIEGGPRWLVLQSSSASTRGAYTLSLADDIFDTDLVSLVQDGERVNDSQVNNEGRIYNLEAAEGDLITLRYAAETGVSPFEVVSLDGEKAREIFSWYDGAVQQWVSLQVVRGEGPFRVIVKTDGDYGLEVDAGDTLTDNQGTLEVGTDLTKSVLNDQSVVVTYDLTLDESDQLNLTLSGNTSVATLRDADNELVSALERINVNSFNVSRYNLPAGSYTVYLEVSGNYGLNLSRSTGPLAETLGQLKGTVLLAQPLEDAIRGETPLGIYNLSEGLGTKPLRENELVTIFMERVGNAGQQTVSIRSNDGLVSQITLDFSNRQQARYISVHQIQGQAPYRVFIIGQNNFRINVVRGNLLANDKGALTIGQTVNDSSNAPEYLNYIIAPEIGKKLVEGDIVTISFVNRGTNQNQTGPRFENPVVEDAKENGLTPIEFFRNDDLFIGVYVLEGQAPYRLSIQNIGAYQVRASIGNNLVVDKGEVEIGQTSNGTTAGPQIINYEVKGEAGQEFTLTVTDTNGGIDSGDALGVDVLNGTEERVERSFSLPGGNFFKRVYTLTGEPPYRLTFTVDGTYEVKLTEGDELTSDKGTWYLGDAEILDIKQEDQGKILIYNLDIRETQVMSIQMLNAFPLLVDPDGDFVDEALAVESYDRGNYTGRVGIYDFAKVGNYQLVVVPFGRHTLRVTPGEVITVQKGNAYFDVLETDKLENNKRYAAYTINAEEGEFITVRFEEKKFTDRRRFMSADTLTLVNADNQIISRDWIVQDWGYNLFVYDLVGPGPYTLFVQPQRDGSNFDNAFRPQEEYKLTIVQGDDARYDMGGIQVDETKEDELTKEEGRRTLIYQLENSQEGREITIELTPTTTRREFEAASLRVYDPDGELVPESIYTFVRSQTGRYSFKLEKQGTYRLEFEMKEKYKLQIIRDDIQKAEFGRLLINPKNPELEPKLDAQGNQEVDADGNPEFEPYEPIITENRLTTDQIVAVYNLEDVEPGDEISIRIEGRLSGNVTFNDPNGLPAFLVTSFPQGNSTIFVYNILTPGPYELRFRPGTGTHKVQVDEGIVLIAELGDLPVNPADPPVTVDNNGREVEFEPTIAEPELKLPQIAALYNIPLEEGATITLQVENNLIDPLVINADGDVFDPIRSVPDGNSFMATYELTGSAPYQVLVVNTRKFEVILTDGDVLTADMGELPVGFLEDPYVNELPTPSRVARHIVDMQPGQLLTVQIKNERNFVVEQLRDANGQLLLPELVDFQGSDNNVTVYLLSGVGPYELSFPAFGEYEVILATGNLIRVDLGFVPFATDTEGELEQPGRVATYAIDGKTDQTVTIRLTDNNRPAIGEFRDANGKLWEPDAISIVRNEAFGVYTLGGPAPYTVTFVSGGEYLLNVSENNLLRADLGGAPFGQEIRNTLEAPAQIAVYEVLAEPGEIVTVALQDRGRPGTPKVKNAEGQELPVDTRVDKRNTSFNVYTLAGSAPYTLEFDAPGAYTLTVNRGNALRSEVATPLPYGELVREQLEFPAEVAVYKIQDVQEGDVISLALQDGSRAIENGVLKNADGDDIKSDASVTKRGFNFKVYTLTGPAPYTITFTAQGRYTARLDKGNVLRADKGVIRFGNTVTDQLAEPQQAAIYIIDGQPDQIISIRLADRGRPLETAELLDADGNEVLPFAEANVNNAAHGVYKLTGTPPYTITFFPGGRYTMSLFDGNIFRAELGTVAFGETVRNRLALPTNIAAYTIYTTSDQLISITLNSSGREFLTPTLTNSDGEVLEPLAVVYNGNNGYVGVFYLEGVAPYTLEFEALSTINYTLLMQRGNVTEVKLDPIGPKAPVEEGGRAAGRGSSGAAR